MNGSGNVIALRDPRDMAINRVITVTALIAANDFLSLIRTKRTQEGFEYTQTRCLEAKNESPAEKSLTVACV